MIPADILPTDPEESKRVEAAWKSIIDRIPAGYSLELINLAKGETLTELRLGERNGHPILYSTVITESQKTTISVGTIEDKPCSNTLTISLGASRLAP
jgi:hypothetical protein